MWLWILSGIAIILLVIVAIPPARKHLLFPICRFLWWFVSGYPLTPSVDTDAPAPAIQPIVALLAIIIGGTVALGAGVQKTGRVNLWYLVVYGCAGLIPIGGMLHFVHKSNLGFLEIAKAVWRGEAKSRQRAYDQKTVAFAAPCAWASALFMLLCVLLVVFEEFPGQARSNRVLYARYTCR